MIPEPNTLSRWKARLACCALLAVLTACASLAPESSWPEGAAPRGYFEQAYREDAENRELQTEEEYLYWVSRFYLGLAMFPGWLDISDEVLAEVNDAEQDDVRRELYELGEVIAAEWSKHKRVHRISNSAVAAWGQAAPEAQRQGDIEGFMQRLRSDVDGLLAGSIDSREITPERYYEYEPF